MKSHAKALALLTIALLALATILPITPALATDIEGSGNVTGQVTVKASQPTVTFSLYSDSDYLNPTTQITPQTPVYMKITVSGKNPLSEYTIKVDLFADSDNNQVGSPSGNTSPETYVTFTISYDGTNWVLNADTGSSSTWSIQLDPSKTQADSSAAGGDFYIIITFGKTAREANTGDQAPAGDWDIIVTATVAGTASGSSSGYGYTVYFYSEVNVNANTIDFGTIEAGDSSQIQNVDGNTANYFTVTIIANGYYDLKATSTATWSTSDGYEISLTTSNPGPGQFSLQVDADGDFNTGAVYVTTDPSTAQQFVDNAGPTNESGDTQTVYMLITLGTNIHTGTYQGTITILAVDGA